MAPANDRERIVALENEVGELRAYLRGVERRIASSIWWLGGVALVLTPLVTGVVTYTLAPRVDTALYAPHITMSPEGRVAALVTAIRELPEDPAYWTREGEPRVAALESRLGWRPSAAERSYAWGLVVRH